MRYADRRIVFLDVDGVLNDTGFRRRSVQRLSHRGPLTRGVHLLDPGPIQQLNDLLARSDALVVLSSDWRRYVPLPVMRTMLAWRGFIGEIVDTTPYLHGSERGREIQQWLDTNGPVRSYVILDDDDDMSGVRESLVLTDGHGLRAVDVERAVTVLSRAT